MNKKFFYLLAFVSFLSQEDYGRENFDFRYSEKVSVSVQRALQEIQSDVREFVEDIQRCLESLPLVRSDQKRACLENPAICEALSEIHDINRHLLDQILDIDTVFREGIEQINNFKNSREIGKLSELTLGLCVALDAEEQYQQERSHKPFSRQETVLLQTLDGDIVQSHQDVSVEELTHAQQVSFCEDLNTMLIIHEKVENLQGYLECIALPKEPSLYENMLQFWKTLF